MIFTAATDTNHIPGERIAHKSNYLLAMDPVELSAHGKTLPELPLQNQFRIVIVEFSPISH